VTKLFATRVIMFSAALLVLPHVAAAQNDDRQSPAAGRTDGQQSNVPAQVRQGEAAVEGAVKRFGIGVVGGLGIDPELVEFGAHGTFAPVFNRNVSFRPGIEFGLGELTTLFGVNLDFLYTLRGTAAGRAPWRPYLGAGPTFGLSHRGFEVDNQGFEVNGQEVDANNRFDFGDTDFNAGFNFIVGAGRRNGVFFEMRATAYGVSKIRFLGGFNF
jgi:hypothetical protein